MRRTALLAALLWTAGYLVFYLIVASSQDDGPAWWYAAFLGVTIVVIGIAGSGAGGPAPTIAAGAMLALATLAGLLSVGLLLLPALIAVGFAAASSATRPGPLGGVT